MNNIDNKIKDVLSEDLDLPSSYKKMVRNTIYETKDKKFFNRFGIAKTLATACTCLVLTTSIVFAKDISSLIKNFFSHNNGMDTAIENGYIYNNSHLTTESNGTKITLNNFLMDTYNLNLDLLVDLDESFEPKEILKMNFPDMIITDENNNILFCQDIETFNKYCLNHNLNYKWSEKDNNNINSGSNYYIKSNDSESINYIYNMYAQNFPKSKKIIVNFNKIILSQYEDINQDTKTIQGNWNFEIDVPEEFYNRNEISYKVKSCSNNNMKITKAVVSETCTKFELELEEKPDLPYELTDDEETKNRKINEYIEKQKNETAEEFLNKRKFKDEYIETETGKKYYPSKTTEQDSGYSNIDMKYLIYWQTFELTKHDTTDILNAHFNYKGEDVVVTLEKE